MPAKRSSNAQKKNSQRRAPQQAQLTPVANDLVGLAIIVVAVTMIVSLVSTSDAVLTHAMAEGLRLGFGEGAQLVPVALILFAVTMFLPTDGSLVARVALGLALVVLSALSMLSILTPGAAESADYVLGADVAIATGGYVGAGVAWLLLTFVGQIVGMVLLVGLAVAGIVVCGFSISNLALRIQRSMGAAADHLAAARERGATRRHTERTDQMAWQDDEPWEDDFEPDTSVMDEPATSFIGSRKTSVLRRSNETTRMDHATGTPELGFEEPAAEPKTTVLRRKRHPKLENEANSAPQFKAEVEPIAEVPSPLEAAKPEKGKKAEKSEPAEPEPLPWEPSEDVLPLAEVAEEPTAAAQPVEPAVPDFLRAAATRANGGETPFASSAEVSVAAGAGAGAVAAGAAAAKTAADKPRPGRGTRKRQEAAPENPARPGDESDDFVLPPLTLLDSNPNSASSATSDAELDRTARRLQSTLEEFGLKSKVSGWTAGPLVTTFKIEMGEGERVNKITNLQDDIQLSLASESVRIYAPIPGTSLVGIEIPNKKRQNVFLGDVLPYAQGGPLEFAIGRDSEGSPVVADLARMPHMLVAGTTGSGKSVLINAIIMSLIMRTTPEQVRLILVDPKRVEFSCYAGLPHLYVPVVTEPRQAASALQWAVTEMDRRLKVFERAGARDIRVYNNMIADGKFDDMENPPTHMPYLVVVIDELSDLMMVAGKDVESSIVRIAQLARAAGIHLVLATQRPSADVVTGLIKSNVDTRVALKVSSSIDSRVILDQTGAERLMGRGDMLFRKAGGVTTRVLGAYASDDEIENVVTFIRDQREPDYHDEILSAVAPSTPGAATADAMEEDDPLVWEAAQVVVDSQLGSTSGLQRRLKVGYARAGRIMDNLEQKGVVGPPDGSKPREVLLDAEGLEELRAAEAKYKEV